MNDKIHSEKAIQTNLFQEIKLDYKPALGRIRIVRRLNIDVPLVQPELTFQFGESPFGEILLAFNKSGIFWLSFVNNQQESLDELMMHFPLCKIGLEESDTMNQVKSWFNPKINDFPELVLQLSCTDFQLKIWNHLLEIPFGLTQTYQSIADAFGMDKGARAVGNAVASNMIAYLIPCHRVLQSNGKLGGFRWGIERKRKLLTWEKAMMQELSVGRE